MTLPLQQKAQAQYQQRRAARSSLESYFQPEEARSEVPQMLLPEVWYQSPALPHPRLLGRSPGGLKLS